MQNTVSVRRCEKYDAALLRSIIGQQFSSLGITAEDFRGKRVALKPNLVVASKNDIAACTDPAVIEAVASVVVSAGAAQTVIAESPGGPYTELTLKHNYKVNGVDAAAARAGAELNFDTGYRTVSAPNGVTSKTFNVIGAIADADVIINICKLKTHTLTGMSCAVKNLFGVVPGTQKFEMHARFTDQMKFGDALIDLCDMLCMTKRVIHVCDAVVGMEGNGPTGGTPREIGCILASESPYALDAVAARLIGHVGQVPMIEAARRRGLCPADRDISVIGDDIEGFIVSDYKHSDAKRGKIFSILPPFLQPRPVITEKCVGCGRCAESCPVHTIEIKEKRAVIGRKQCIKCFCCQELCPFHAVEVKQNFLFRLVP